MHESWSTTGCSMLLAHSEDPFLDIDIACKAWLATWLATFKPGSFRLVNCFQSVGLNACDSRHKLSGSNAGPNASRMFYIFLMDVLHNTAHTRTIRACLWWCLLCHLIWLIWRPQKFLQDHWFLAFFHQFHSAGNTKSCHWQRRCGDIGQEVWPALYARYCKMAFLWGGWQLWTCTDH